MFINDKKCCADFLRLEQGVHAEFSSGKYKQKKHELEQFTVYIYISNSSQALHDNKTVSLGFHGRFTSISSI